MTKAEIIKWAEDVENFSGITCSNIRELKPEATQAEFNKAKAADVQFFKGFVNDLELKL